MIWFPQMSTGTAAQLPLVRRRIWRSIENRLESGERIALPDRAAAQIEWRMDLREMSDSESEALSALFDQTGGPYGSFGFVDPLANLLGWSEDLSKPDWQPGLLTVSAGAADAFGGQTAWTIGNPAAGDQTLLNSVALPAEYVACFSVWLRAETPLEAMLTRDAAQSAVTVGSAWKRFFLSAPGSASSASFGVTIPSGSAIQACGFQAEAQPYPSQYKRTGKARGLYAETRFAQNELTLTATSPGMTACRLTLMSRI